MSHKKFLYVLNLVISFCSLTCLCCTDDEEKATYGDTATESGSSADTATADTDTGISVADQTPIAETYASYFSVGVAVATGAVSAHADLLSHHFNRLTAENVMKPDTIQPSEGNFSFTGADTIANYARANNMTMTGHVLVWHRQMANWMFSDLQNGNADDIEILKGRMKAHIEAMVSRYYDVVDNWDVVNEAMSEELSEIYRTDSKWYQAFGSEEYIYWAFKYAKDALEAMETGGSEGRLYYNDYDCTINSSKIMTMLDWLENEKGIRIDGVGMQAHWTLDFPTEFSIQRTIDKFVAAGYKVKISEMDITIYNDYQTSNSDVEAEKAFTAEIESLQAERYGQLFSIFRSYSDAITSVTIWGIADSTSWLNDTPVSGRSDYPLLFDANYQPKEALDAITTF